MFSVLKCPDIWIKRVVDKQWKINWIFLRQPIDEAKPFAKKAQGTQFNTNLLLQAAENSENTDPLAVQGRAT